jgi:NTE family protein
VLVRPELGDISAANFTRGIEGIPAGEAAMLGARGELSRLILSETDYAVWKTARAERGRTDNTYGSVRIVGVTPAVERLLLDQASVPSSGELDPIRMQTVINRWNANADFDRIGYSLQPGNPSQVLQINVAKDRNYESILDMLDDNPYAIQVPKIARGDPRALHKMGPAEMALASC